jgi:cytochrome b pre-mRNA-processing protein 3
MPSFRFPQFKEHPAKAEARQLLATVTAAAREPGLFGDERVPDTFDGRFQVLTLCGVLALRRLTAAGDQAALVQAFTDALFLNFDDGLREGGIGDLSVAKHMKKLGQAFYGRYGAYEAALASDDKAALIAALSRNVWGENPAPFAPELADKAFKIANRLNSVAPAELASPAHWAAG